jgi:hypothetical protein
LKSQYDYGIEMAEVFSTPDDPGPILMSDVRAMDVRFHDKQAGNAEIALALFVLVLILIFAGPRLWRRARAHLAGPAQMPDPVD